MMTHRTTATAGFAVAGAAQVGCFFFPDVDETGPSGRRLLLSGEGGDGARLSAVDGGCDGDSQRRAGVEMLR